MTVQIQGLDRFVAELAAKAVTVPAEAGAATLAAARRTADAMRAAIPKRTGAMAASVAVFPSREDADVAAEVGPTVPYARFVEYGTSRMAPRPFLDRASTPNIVRYVDDLGDVADL